VSRLTRLFGGMALVAVGALAIRPAVAHHSFAQFDMSKTESIHGTLYVVEWTNPHSWLWIKADNGVKWGFEAGAPAQLVRNGFPRSSLQVGSPLTVIYHPVRDPRVGNGGSMITVKFDDGRLDSEKHRRAARRRCRRPRWSGWSGWSGWCASWRTPVNQTSIGRGKLAPPTWPSGRQPDERRKPDVPACRSKVRSPASSRGNWVRPGDCRRCRDTPPNPGPGRSGAPGMPAR